MPAVNFPLGKRAGDCSIFNQHATASSLYVEVLLGNIGNHFLGAICVNH